jgi:hypothetical protein
MNREYVGVHDFGMGLAQPMRQVSIASACDLS